MLKKSKEEKRAYNKEYYQKNKEKLLNDAKIYHKKHKYQLTTEQKAKAVERSKKSYLKNKDNLEKQIQWRAYKSEWYRDNKEDILKKKKIWRQQMLGSLEYRFKRVIQTAKQRNISFSLTFEQFLRAANQPCYYCNFKLCSQVKEGSGLDRIDSNKGYEIGNVISCGHRCNMIKNDDLTMEETKAAVEAILNLRLVKEYESRQKS